MREWSSGNGPGEKLLGCKWRLLNTSFQEGREEWHVDVQPNESQAARMTNSNTSVQPYLFFNGRCEEALEFYRSALGAAVEMLSRFKDAPEPGMEQPGMENKGMHTSLRAGETLLNASERRRNRT